MLSGMYDCEISSQSKTELNIYLIQIAHRASYIASIPKSSMLHRTYTGIYYGDENGVGSGRACEPLIETVGYSFEDEFWSIIMQERLLISPIALSLICFATDILFTNTCPTILTFICLTLIETDPWKEFRNLWRNKVILLVCFFILWFSVFTAIVVQISKFVRKFPLCSTIENWMCIYSFHHMPNFNIVCFSGGKNQKANWRANM